MMKGVFGGVPITLFFYKFEEWPVKSRKKEAQIKAEKALNRTNRFNAFLL